MDWFNWRRGFSGWGGMGLFNGLVGIGMLTPKNLLGYGLTGQGQRVKRMMEGFLIFMLAFPVILFYGKYLS